MSRFTQRGYIVKENGPVYYARDLEATIRWFERVLGWYGEIDEADPDGKGLYGCVYSLPPEVEAARVAPFTGIHLFRGEPHGGLLCLMEVRGVETLRRYILSRNWQQVTELFEEPWGRIACVVTTPDGYELEFFE